MFSRRECYPTLSLLAVAASGSDQMFFIEPQTGTRTQLDWDSDNESTESLYRCAQISSTEAVVIGGNGLILQVSLSHSDDVPRVLGRAKHGNYALFALSYITGSSGSRLIASGGIGCDISIRNVDDLTETCRLGKEHGGWVTRMLHDSILLPNLLISTSQDTTARIWDLTNEVSLRTLSEHEGQIWDISPNRFHQLFATAAWDRTIKLWDSRSFDSVNSIELKPNRVSCITFRDLHPHQLVAQTDDGPIFLYDIRHFEKPLGITPDSIHSGGYGDLCDAADHDIIVSTGYQDRLIKAWKLNEEDDGLSAEERLECIWESAKLRQSVWNIIPVILDFEGFMSEDMRSQVEVEDEEERFGYLISMMMSGIFDDEAVCWMKEIRVRSLGDEEVLVLSQWMRIE